jgi:glycosyltransferase involved in cell wall biosynthesis
LRIGVVGPAHPYRGGIAQFLAVLCSELKSRGNTLGVFNFTRQYPSVLFPGRAQTTDSAPAIAVESKRTVDSINPLTWFRTYRALRAFKPDVVLMSWWTPFFAPCFWTIAFLMRRLGRVPVVYVCHNVIPHERRFVDVPLTKLALGEADFLVLLSKQSESELKGLLPKSRYTALYHPRYSFFLKPGLTRARAREGLGVSGRALLFFGYVRPYKGLGVLLDAFAAFAARDDEARLLVVGEFYEDREPYEAQIERLRMGDRVTLVDRYVSDDEVAHFFLAADLLVLPYLSATQSGVIQIAQSFGLPVVTTDVGGLPEVVEDGKTGFLVPAGDPEALAGAIGRFFDGGWRERMAPHLERAAARFSWDPVVEAITSFAGEAAGGSRGGRG